MNTNQTSIVEEEAIAKISGQTPYSSLEFSQHFNVRLPEQSEKMFIDLEDVNKIIQICDTAKKWIFPLGELLLALSMLFLGGGVGLLLQNDTDKSPLVFTPMQLVVWVLGVGCFVAFLFIRKGQSKDLKHFAERIEDKLSRYASTYNKKGE